jgi:hopene-associated glycosyltransferase HpnB
VLAVLVVACLGAVSTSAWLVVLLGRARAWDLRPVGEEEPEPSEPAAWPSVAVLVPARNEGASLPHTLPALLAQDYPGKWQVVLADDRSTDGTAGLAHALGGGRLTVLEGAALPDGWVGKVWALEQARAAAGAPDYLLLTDADIRHARGSLRRLVAESEAGAVGLNSRMAKLRCGDAAERLLIPPFLFFFNLLYPMRRVNDPRSRVAAAAGGCMLLRRDVLERAGGLRAIRGEIIDDVNLARLVKATGAPVRLAVSRTDVISTREYGSVGAVWRMVRRSAFDELRYSWVLLALVVALLTLMFALPPLALATALAAGASGAGWPLVLVLALSGLAPWALQLVAFLPAVRFFGLHPAWALTLPLAGMLYGGMTIDSARLHAQGVRQW